MIKNNKVINKIVLPKAMALCLLLGMATTASVYITQSEAAQKAGNIRKQDIWLMVPIIALMVIFFYLELLSDYKRGEKYLMPVVRKYLKEEIKNVPVMKLYEQILDNHEAMLGLSALAFNSLRPSERKEVAQIILNSYNRSRNIEKYSAYESVSKYNAFESVSLRRKEIRKIYDETQGKIIAIIKAHASAHPEFIDDICVAMAKASNTAYTMEKRVAQQRTK